MRQKAKRTKRCSLCSHPLDMDGICHIDHEALIKKDSTLEVRRLKIAMGGLQSEIQRLRELETKIDPTFRAYANGQHNALRQLLRASKKAAQLFSHLTWPKANEICDQIEQAIANVNRYKRPARELKSTEVQQSFDAEKVRHLGNLMHSIVNAVESAFFQDVIISDEYHEGAIAAIRQVREEIERRVQPVKAAILMGKS